MSSIPLVDVPLLRRPAGRTRAARTACAALVVLLAALAFLAALGRPTQAAAYLPRGTNGIVVLDVSASISADTYARIAATLNRLARSGGRYGLVLFSDTAYQALPPETPAAELRPFERYFDVPQQRVPGIAPALPPSPWSNEFSAGTKISTGLELALDVIRGDRVRDPAILLVSDLDDDSGDLERLTRIALTLKRLDVPVHVVGLNPSPEDERLIGSLLPAKGDLVQARLPDEPDPASRSSTPTGLVVAVALLAAALAAFLLLTERLRWTVAR
jgi:hypothetical protein